MATLLASRLASSGIALNPVHVFGSPRVADKAFAVGYSDYGVEHYRMTRDVDFVTYIPLALGWSDFFKMLAYRHVGDEAWLEAGKCSITSGWGTAVGTLAGRVFSRGAITELAESLADHAIDGYVEDLARVQPCV